MVVVSVDVAVVSFVDVVAVAVFVDIVVNEVVLMLKVVVDVLPVVSVVEFVIDIVELVLLMIVVVAVDAKLESSVMGGSGLEVVLDLFLTRENQFIRSVFIISNNAYRYRMLFSIKGECIHVSQNLVKNLNLKITQSLENMVPSSSDSKIVSLKNS